MDIRHERKLQELLQKVVKESKKKGLTTNCKKTECMAIKRKKKENLKITTNWRRQNRANRKI